MIKTALLFLSSALLFSACNNDVFIEPLAVEPDTATLQWTGGDMAFSSNVPISYVDLLVFRWVNGKASAISTDGWSFGLTDQYPRLEIHNDMCDISVAKDPSGKLLIHSGYNLFPDTIYFNIELNSEFELATCGARILPSPGFGHGEISYDLTSYETVETSDTIVLMNIVGPADETPTLTLKHKGDTLACQAIRFAPADKLISDNIFGREPFKVDGIKFDPATMWWPELSGEKILYSSSYQKIKSNPLLYDDDVKVTMPGNSAIITVRAIVTSERTGIYYEIPAISPLPELRDRIIIGKCWIATPMSYKIEVVPYNFNG